MAKALKFVIILFVVSLLAGSVQTISAQCAMCTVSVESNAKSGSTTTKGLNNGIMYLLAAPYLAIGVVGFVWYKKYRRKSIPIQMRGEKLHLN
ncbi:hypothetical protein GCM10027049_24620 [Mucilaginibacter puniceus]